MKEIDYFNEDNIVRGGFIEFKKFGDNVAGTLIDKEEKPSNLDPEKMQMIYTIRRDDGSIALVGGKAYLDNQMKFVKIGQKIALKYVSDKPAKKKGMNPMKIINLYTPKNEDGSPMFDSEYSFKEGDEQESFDSPTPTKVDTAYEDDGEISVDSIPFDNAPKATPETSPEVDKLKEITELSKQKLGITSDEEVSMAVMKATGLAFLEENYDKILEILKTK
jgi:hypothetical protein